MAIASAVLAAVFIGTASCSHHDAKAGPSKRPSTSPTPVNLPAEQVRALQTDLTSGRPAQVRAVMAVPTKQALRPDFVRQLAGLNISLHRETAVEAGKDRVEVHATVSGRDKIAHEWIVLLGQEGQRYVVLSTREANK
jgi:hypothetical protein